MARDPKEWAAEIADKDRDEQKLCCGSTYDDGMLCKERMARIIREAQEDGAAEWMARSETLTDDNMAMAAEIAELRSRLSNVASTAQGAANRWEPAQGLEAIYHIATTEPEKAPGEADDGTPLPDRCLVCRTDKDVLGSICEECFQRGVFPF